MQADCMLTCSRAFSLRMRGTAKNSSPSTAPAVGAARSSSNTMVTPSMRSSAYAASKVHVMALDLLITSSAISTQLPLPSMSCVSLFLLSLLEIYAD